MENKEQCTHRYECETVNEPKLASHFVSPKIGDITGMKDEIKKIIFCIYCGDSKQIYPPIKTN
jgi:hypothetical protein